MGQHVVPPFVHNDPWGWYCTRHWAHSGPCNLRPRWWMKALIKVKLLGMV